MLLRPFTRDDAAGILAIYGPVVAHSSATFEWEVPSLSDFTERLAHIAGRFPFLVAEDDQGGISGYAYATTHRDRIAYQWAVETSVYVAQPGQGVGRKLYNALLPQLTERGFLWAYGVITLPNDASLALHAACGYEGFARYADAGQKFGQWWDVQWVRKQLNTPLPHLPAPRFEGASVPVTPPTSLEQNRGPMRLTRMQWILISGAAIIAAYTGFAYTQSKKLDRPSYEVVKRDRSFEIRDYGARLWAEVSVSQAEYGAMSREGFRPLARYIFGGNESQTSMAMTAPVSLIMEQTDPRMRFFMSDKGRAADLPKPLQEGIRFIEEPAQRYAVLSYGGLLSQERNMEFGQKLKAWCDAEGLVIEGPLEVYGYNAPYEVIRHNEVAYPIGRR